MRDNRSGWRWAILWAALASPALAQPAATPGGAPPERTGPVWDYRDHQPTPAEIEARDRARGIPQQRQNQETREVDQLYRDLMGSNPQAPPPATSRETGRR